MNLLVVAAACHGWHMSDILRPVDRAPAWAILGPPESEKAGKLYEAMERFYHSLLTSMNLSTAMEAMNAGAGMAYWSYRIQSADLLFCQVFRHNLSRAASQRASRTRA